MAGIGTALMIATAGLGVASSIAKGIATQNQMEAQANALEANAEILQRNAAQKRLETSLNEDTQRRKNKLALAKSRAAMAEAGISEGGTAIGVIGQSAADAEQDALNLRYQGESEAVNYLNNAKIMNANAENYREAGQNAFTTGLISGAFSGLSALATGGFLTDWMAMQQLKPRQDL